MKKGILFLSVAWGVCILFPLGAQLHAAGLKKTIAVSRFENKSSWRGQWQLDDGMADQLTEALVATGKFVVLERQTLGDVLTEQDLAASGRAAKSKTAQTGKIIPAQILITGAITEFEEKSAGAGGGVSVGKLKIGGKGGTAHVGLIVRLIDTTTSEVLLSERAEGTAKAGGLGFQTTIENVTFGSSGFKKTPLGKATQQAIDKAVSLITSEMETVPFEGKVIKVQADKIYVNVGEQNGIQPNSRFTVYRLGEAIVDEDTGQVLGSEEENTGVLKIVEVKEKYATATAAGGCKIEKGDVIREE
jgi:curli biogenesis system outer membrane secretion channel CsgG